MSIEFEQAQRTRTFKHISPLLKYVNSFINNTIFKTFNDPLRYEFIFMFFYSTELHLQEL